jgi:hypothetical protein
VNKKVIHTVAVLLGSSLGFYIGVDTNQSGLDLVTQIFSGAFFGYLIGLALIWNKYGVIIWSLVSLVVDLFVDWVAGSSWTVIGRLEFMAAGLLLGWDFWYFRKQVTLLGVIGALCGFVLGMNKNLWFGTVRLDAGWLSAVLLAVKFSILGMGYGRLLIEIFGWRPKVDTFES